MEGVMGNNFRQDINELNGIADENHLFSIDDEKLRNEIKGKLVINSNRKNSSVACTIQ